MKNSRRYRIPAILLAIIMIIGIMPATVMADVLTFGEKPYIYDASANNDAVITFSSGDSSVNNIEDLVPGKNTTMTIAIPASDALPKNSKGEIRVKIPDNVIITSQDISACSNKAVSCYYLATTNQLVFKWADEPQDGFAATIPVTPDVPSTVGLNGRYIVTTVKGNQQAIAAMKAQARTDVKRLVSSTLTRIEGKLNFEDNNAYIWSFNHVSGDWYTISNNGSYLKMNKNDLTLTNEENATIFHVKQEPNGYVIESNGFYLNTKGDNAANGMQGSNYSPMGQWVKLYSTSELFDDTKGYIKLNANGGNVSISANMISGEPGSVFSLPEYSGTKSGKAFIGWAKYANIYENHDGTNSSYCEVYFPGTEMTFPNGVISLYAVFNEKGTDARFGIRKDGNIPHEPDNFDVKEYHDYHQVIKNAVNIGRWVVDVDGNKPVEGNHIVNNVTNNLSSLPSDSEIKKMTKEYDPETMYVHWYVMKYSGNQWKIDGVIRKRASKSIAYDMNMQGEDRNYVVNMPKGFEFGKEISTKVGAESDGTVKTPSLKDYEFLGWNTQANGKGTFYEAGEEISISASTTFYAQWRKIPKHEVSYNIEAAPRGVKVPEPVQYFEDGIVELTKAKEVDGYIFSGWMINGEKITDDTFTMPDENVVITGTYYGPIDVGIRSEWPEGKIGYPGAKVTLHAVTTGPENLDYSYQWQYLVGSEWIDLPGAEAETLNYELNEETSGRTWRVVVTDVKPHQDNE